VAAARRHPRFLMRRRPTRLQAPHPSAAASQPDEMRRLAGRWPPASPGHRLAGALGLGRCLIGGRAGRGPPDWGVEWVWEIRRWPPSAPSDRRPPYCDP
jgi:hypothetical protein